MREFKGLGELESLSGFNGLREFKALRGFERNRWSERRFEGLKGNLRV